MYNAKRFIYLTMGGIFMRKLVYIEGMSCSHCVNRVKGAIGELEGVIAVDVSLEEKRAIVQMEREVSDEAIKAAVEEWGYSVTSIETA